MKKTFLSIGVVVMAALGSQAAVLTTNWTDATGHPAFLLTTNRASVYSWQVIAPANAAVVVNLYDNDSLSQPYFGTNYTNQAYYTRAGYATNIVGTFVGANGYTNYTTNAGWFSGSNYVAIATNQLPIIGTIAVPANMSVTLNSDMLFERGISVQPSTNGTIVVYYR